MSNELDWLEIAKAVLVHDEGLERRPYKDTKGNWTIGVGYYIGPRLEDLTLSHEAIQVLLREKIETHLEDLYSIFGEQFDSFLVPRQIALLSMMYSLGKGKFLTFRYLIEAIKRQDWETAAHEALDSKWAEDVNPKRIANGRDDRIATMLAHGRLHPEYKR